VFDKKNITPFFKKVKFPLMAESGWLTRSLEQKMPYDFDYKGAIRPDSLKDAFLNTIDIIERNDHLGEILNYFFQGLIIQRNKQRIVLAKPLNLGILKIVDLLISHFNLNYLASGESRLPVLALYASYQCLINEIHRYDGKRLLKIESHTSADLRSGRIGDIDIVDKNNKVFESVEVKHGIKITSQLVRDAFDKFKMTQLSRYYLFSTVGINKNDLIQIDIEIDRIKNLHGCEVIVNGLEDTLKYYLRLIGDTSIFIENYVELLAIDKSIKYEHKAGWNNIIAGM